MIKPVKRNKRLKWIDSHYAKAFLKPKLTLAVNAKHFNKAMRKAVKSINRFGASIERFQCETVGLKEG